MALFDQKKWIAEHADDLKGKDVDQVFRYVVTNHPNMGCAFLPNTGWSFLWSILLCDPKRELKKMKTMSLEDMSKYADAVTVARVDDVSKGPIPEKGLDDTSTNKTTVGNVAYVALNAEDEQVRITYTKIIQTWKDAK